MKEFFKLVRDKIPDIIEENGEQASIKRLIVDDDYKEALAQKLQEEVKEYITDYAHGDTSCRELIDVLDVVDALLEAYNIDKKEFNKERALKNKIKGGFKKRIFLKTTN